MDSSNAETVKILMIIREGWITEGPVEECYKLDLNWPSSLMYHEVYVIAGSRIMMELFTDEFRVKCAVRKWRCVSPPFQFLCFLDVKGLFCHRHPLCLLFLLSRQPWTEYPQTLSHMKPLFFMLCAFGVFFRNREKEYGWGED